MAAAQHKSVKDETHLKLVRVICTDPDATESSDEGSGEEDEEGQAMSKRFVREIPLSVITLSHRDDDDNNIRQTHFPNPLRSPNPKRPPVTRRKTRKEAKTKDLDAIKQKHHRLDSGKLDGDAKEGDCYPQESQFSMFLSELLVGPREYGDSVLAEDVLGWETEAGREDMTSNIMDLELDSEAITWMNSLQR